MSAGPAATVLVAVTVPLGAVGRPVDAQPAAATITVTATQSARARITPGIIATSIGPPRTGDTAVRRVARDCEHPRLLSTIDQAMPRPRAGSDDGTGP
jgi:hypothetical protein